MILNEMAISRQQALSVVDSYVVEYSNHLLKCIIFKNTTNTLNHWISEISNYFNEINNIKIKPDNKKMREDYLYDYFFLASGDVEDDYSIIVKAFQLKEGKKYPKFKITKELIEEIYNTFLDFANYFAPILSRKNNYNKNWFQLKILEYFNTKYGE